LSAIADVQAKSGDSPALQQVGESLGMFVTPYMLTSLQSPSKVRNVLHISNNT
jgi:hypothetical protein